MGRNGAAAAAKSGSSESASNSSVFLVLPNNSNGSSTAVVRSEPYGRNSFSTDFAALVMLASLQEYPTIPSKGRVNEKRKQKLDQLQQRVRQEKNNQKLKLEPASYAAFSTQPVFKISATVWMIALDFLVFNNTSQCIPFIPLVLAPENFLNDLGRIKSLISHLTPRLQNSLFSENYEKGYEITCLLDAALNADLAVVERILSSSKNLQAMLRAKGRATITHLNIKRTGKPLQMAIYDHDEEMVAAIKRHMDPAEFQSQCKAVVGMDYDAFLRKQEAEATTLCAGLEDAFNAGPWSEFTVDNSYSDTASVTSPQLPRTIDAFINKLMDYVKNNPVHNPTILQCVYEIYSRLPSDFDLRCFFSQKVIGGVQSFLSARWLQHYAQGIAYLAKNDKAPRRSFICRNAMFDTRHLLGPGWCCLEAAWRSGNVALGLLRKIMSDKNSKLSELYAASAIDSQLRNAMTLSR